MTYLQGGLKSHALKTEFRLRKPRTLGEIFKTTKHVALTSEMPDMKTSAFKETSEVNKAGSAEFSSCPEE